MNFLNLIGILFIFNLTKELCGHILPCTNNANCTAIVPTASCTTGGFCQCQAGYVFTTDFTQCLDEVLYGVKCTDDVQCSHMLTGGYCDESNLCSCRTGFTFIRGRCRQLVNLGERCDEDIDCSFNFDRESVTCRNNVCICSDGFYLRTTNVCRRISMINGDPCIVNTDCQNADLFCNATSNKCTLNSVGIQTELYKLPQTRSVGTQAEITPPITTKEESKVKNEANDDDAKFGDPCVIEGVECSGLEHSICRDQLCRCNQGYYIQTQQCKAEIGEPAVSGAYCVGTAPTVEYRDGKCLCGVNLFSNNNLRTCVKASTGYGNGCTQNSQCTPYGLAYCTSISPKICQCYPYAEYDAKLQLCIKKVGYEEFCTTSEECTLKNTVCTNENTCVCGSNYIEIDKVCWPGNGAACTTAAECGFKNSECVNNIEGDATEKYCKCKPGLLYHNFECIPEVQHEEECDVDEQCKPLLGDLGECKDNKCLCEDGAHFKDEKCHTTKQLGEGCKKSSDCFVAGNPDSVVCRNSACNCKFGYTADVEKQQCIVVKNTKSPSGRPSPFKVITIILMTSAALITSAAIREAYFVR